MSVENYIYQVMINVNWCAGNRWNPNGIYKCK
jgi:hypothetical protein